MKEGVKKFLECLDRKIPELLKQDEKMAALLVANMFVDQGISPGEVLRALKRAGLPCDPKLLAGFRDKREDLIAALELL